MPSATTKTSGSDDMAAAHKKIVVCGGTGFLGSRICKAAATRNWTVTSLSRSGDPNWSSITSSSTPPPWASQVKWEKADLLQPGSYSKHLEGADAVVHSMGILLEADYKGALTGKESIWNGISRAFSSKKEGARGNPLERRQTGQEERLESGERDGQLTYELMNRDSAIALARSSAAASVSSFVFISAAGGAPVLPTRYITTKREAESAIASNFPNMRSIFMRPGFLTDPSRAFTVPLGYAMMPAVALNWAVGGRLSGIAGAAVEKPSKADDVANAVVEAIADDSMRGALGTEDIDKLATKAWRRGML